MTPDYTPDQLRQQKAAYQAFEDAFMPIEGVSPQLNELVRRQRVRHAIEKLGRVHRSTDSSVDGFEHHDIAGGGDYNLAPQDQ